MLKPCIVAFSLVNFTMAYLNAFAPELYGRHRVWIVGRIRRFRSPSCSLPPYCLHFGNASDLREALRVEKGEHAMAESVRTWRDGCRATRATSALWSRSTPRSGKRSGGGGRTSTRVPPLLSSTRVYRRVLALPHARVPRHVRVQLVMRLAVIVALYFVYLGLQNPAAPFQDILPQRPARRYFRGWDGAGAALALMISGKSSGSASRCRRREAWMSHVRGEPRGGAAATPSQAEGRSASQREGRGEGARWGAESRKDRRGRGRGRRTRRGQAPGARAATASSLATPSGLRRSAGTEQ